MQATITTLQQTTNNGNKNQLYDRIFDKYLLQTEGSGNIVSDDVISSDQREREISHNVGYKPTSPGISRRFAPRNDINITYFLTITQPEVCTPVLNQIAEEFCQNPHMAEFAKSLNPQVHPNPAPRSATGR